MDEAIENMETPDDPKPVKPKNTEPVAVASGMNHDAIVEAQPAQSRATIGIDGGSRAFYSAALRTEGGLPADRLVTSEGQDVRYELADYAGNNVLTLRQQGETITAAFEPFATTDLYILATSGNGESQLRAVINYDDGTQSAPATLSIRDWSLRNPDGTQAMAGIGNINLSSNDYNSGDCHDALYDLHLSADATKRIQSVTFTSENSSLPTLFAFSREVLPTSDYEPVTVISGFNADVVAETQNVGSSINQTLDGNYALYAQSAHMNGGLPNTRTITSVAKEADYQLLPYNTNNALTLSNTGQKGTLGFSELFNTSELLLLATSANGTSSVVVTILYEDGTTKQSPQLYINDWYVTSPNGTEAIAELGRVSRRGGFSWGFSENLNFALYDISVETDEHKNIQSITIENNSGSIPTIFAVSKKKTDVEPDPLNAISPLTADDGTETLYSPQGIKLQHLQRGLNIIRQADGTTRKLIVR